MIVFSESDRFAIGSTPEGDAQMLYDSAWGTGWLGFDRERKRMIEIHQPMFEGSRAGIQKRVLRERLSATHPLSHPGLASIIKVGEDAEGDLFFITEFVDGERLQSYLRRQHPISRRLGMCVMLQMAEVIGYLADHPRVLASVRLEDFSVSLDRGRFISVRLTDFGFDQEEKPVRDTELAARWIRWIGGLVEGVLQSRSIQLRDISEACPTANSPLDLFVKKLMSRPGSSAMGELKRLKSVLIEAAGLSNEPGSHMRPEFRSVESYNEVPLGPLTPLVCDREALEAQLDTRYQLLHDAARREAPEGNDWSPFRQRADDRANGRTAQIALLPPERLIDQTGTSRLHEKMGHPYLKEHPSLIRTRSISSDANATLTMEDHFHGFSLASLVAQRGRLTPTEVVAMLRELDSIFTQLDGADFRIEEIEPWQIWFHFDPPLAGPKMRSVLAQENFQQWPGYEMKVRVNPTTESVVEGETSSWTHLLRRMNGLCLPTLALWLLEGNRFEWALIEGKATTEPLSWNPQLEDFFNRVISRFDVADSEHRKLFVESLASMFTPTVPLELTTDEPVLAGAEETLTAAMFQGGGARRPGGAATRAHEVGEAVEVSSWTWASASRPLGGAALSTDRRHNQ